MRYAMILKNRVIDVKESEKEPKYPPDIYGNKVTTIECSGDVSVGMIYNAKTGNFAEYKPPEPEPTQLDRIEEQLGRTVQEIENSAIDRYNLELVKEGVL